MPTDASLRALKILRDGSQFQWYVIPWLIFLLGYLPFFLVSFWVHDMASLRRQSITVAGIFALDIGCLIVFAGVLKWI